MGHDIHITRRKESWDKASGPAISLAEFDRLIQGDSELRADTVNGPGHGTWKARGIECPFWLMSREITSKNPPDEFVRAMNRMAKKLKARVVGDDDEEYGADGAPIGSTQSSVAPSDSANSGWSTMYVVIGLSLLVIVVATVLLVRR